jgi:tellurite resistance protein TerC
LPAPPAAGEPRTAMTSIAHPTLWTFFLVGCAVLLALDLLVLNRGSKVISTKIAIRNTLFFICAAALFAGYLAFEFGGKTTLEFVTGYLIEYALSVDNLFVFLVVFTFFRVPAEQQHRVLFWGILGAVALRGVFIVAGAALLAKFSWMIFVFGAFLVYTGVKLLFVGDSETDPSKNPVLLFAQRFLRVTPHFHGKKFFVRENGLLTATPLFLTLFVVELTDVVFAVDSIPAIFAVTRDPFLVFSSNIFAILGLRSLYFVLADMMGRFYYLKYGLGLVLSFVGLKMLSSPWWHLPIAVSLSVIVLLLGGSVAASWLWPPAAALAREREASAAKEQEKGEA